MAYTYKYIPASQPIQYSASEEFDNLLQEDLNQMFYESDNVITIQEETALASNVYQNVDVRTLTVVNLQTGERQGDDFRTLLFKDLNHSVNIGRYYKFLNNYWISVNTDKVNKAAVTTTVRRCNNMLRWIDTNGGYHEVPCSIGYLIKENRDYSTAGSNVVVPSGMIDVLVQDNTHTKTLKPNQRFLFGNSGHWTSYRIEGGGFGNFNNQETADNNSGGLLRLNLAVDFTNYDTDDLENGIADGLQYIYDIALNQNSISGDAGQTVQLQASVTVNNEIVSRNLIWASDDEEIATVDLNGLVTFISEGAATITCSLANNANIKDTCEATVGAIPVDNYQIRFNPTTNYILEGESQIYTCYLYKNNIQQVDAFVFTLDPNTTPSSKYSFSVLGDNSFKIINVGMFLTDTLEITATSGIRSKTISVALKGAW